MELGREKAKPKQTRKKETRDFHHFSENKLNITFFLLILQNIQKEIHKQSSIQIEALLLLHFSTKKKKKLEMSFTLQRLWRGSDSLGTRLLLEKNSSKARSSLRRPAT